MAYPITQDYGQNGEKGIDYGLPVGTPIYAPVSGTLRQEDLGKSGWGKRVLIQINQTTTFAVGHLTSFVASPGPVSAGQLIGFSGGATSDPSSGISTGPHVEVQLLQNNQFINPHSFMSSLSQDIFGQANSSSSSTSSGNPITDAIGNAVTSIGSFTIDFGMRAAFIGVGGLLIVIGFYVIAAPQIKQAAGTAVKAGAAGI